MKKWIAICLGAIVLAGCSSNTAGLRIDSASQKVLYSDSGLDDSLTIESIDTQDKNGRTRGIVRITNNEQSNQNLQYRFYWYDDDGIEVNAKQGAWRQFIISGYETQSLSETSVNPNATEFRIQIRPQD